jgi:hypothetical protein
MPLYHVDSRKPNDRIQITLIRIVSSTACPKSNDRALFPSLPRDRLPVLVLVLVSSAEKCVSCNVEICCWTGLGVAHFVRPLSR